MKEPAVGLTRSLASFSVQMDHRMIPPEVLAHAKVAFKDWLAVTLAGKDDPLVGKLIRYADQMGGNPQATILGYGFKKSLSHAALINGSASHALDYDDTLRNFLGHPSVTLFPGILALAEWEGKSGADFLTAYLVGLKAGAVIGAGAGLNHYMAGWHSTSTIGHLASAVACARIKGLDEDQTVCAMGIAGTQSSGLKRVFGTMCKPFHAGRAAQVGLTAALLAEGGFTSAGDILEGPHGFFHVLHGQANQGVADTLGKTWEIESLAQKYHASCHATHSAIEAALSIVRENGLYKDDIRSIKISTSQLSLDAAGQMRPDKGLAGKFSIPFCVANALITGNTGMQAFTDEKVNDAEIRKLMEKISVGLHESYKMLEAKVDVETKSGDVFTRESDIMKDIPSLEEKQVKIDAKFVDLCGGAIGGKKTRKLNTAIDNLENLDDMRAFIRLLN